MKFKKLNSNREVNINISKYLINWHRQVSVPQKKFKDFVHIYWKNCVVLEELRLPSTLLRLDLVNLSRKIIVEISPNKVHFEYNKFFHGSRAGFLDKIKKDMQKYEWAQQNGFQYLELVDKDLDNLSYKYIQDNFHINL